MVLPKAMPPTNTRDASNIKSAQFRQTKLLRRRKSWRTFSANQSTQAPQVAVANSPLKPTIPPIRERILGPLSRYPLVKNALVKKPISRPTLNPVSSIEAELAEVRSAWARYRSTNSRDAVYIYLESVFAARYAMAAPQLRGEEFSGGPSPSARRTADEARTIRQS